MRNKFGARKTLRDGILFDSKLEADRYIELKLLQAGKVISNLKLQVPYELKVNDQLICRYIPDFVYTRGSSTVIEDAKGRQTSEFRLKKKLMKACLGIEIELFPPVVRKPRLVKKRAAK